MDHPSYKNNNYHNSAWDTSNNHIPSKDSNAYALACSEEPQTDDEFMQAWDSIFGKNIDNPVHQETEDKSFWDTPIKRTQQIKTTPKRIARHHRGKKIIISLFTLVILYLFLVFSNVTFIAKWRTIYIETAMSTMTHQWLATAFIPGSIIEQVMFDRDNMEALQNKLESNWSISPYSAKELYLPWEKAQKNFADIYSEINQTSFNEYITDHADMVLNNDGYLIIDQAELGNNGTTIETIYGDQVLAIDTYNALTIIKVKGDGYVGRLAIVKDPSRVGIGLSESFGEKGSLITDMAEANNAVLAINANGFYDPDGHGNGGNVFGLVVKDGKLLNAPLGGTNKVVGFDNSNRLNIGGPESVAIFRDAAEFKPALIINGEILVTGSAGWGIQPRSVIGQTEKGEVLLLIIDGRSPGYSIGCTLGEAAQIMKRYGAYQAINLDGGSSSIMYYNGREISKPSAANKINGRNIPNGFMLFKRD